MNEGNLGLTQLHETNRLVAGISVTDRPQWTASLDRLAPVALRICLLLWLIIVTMRGLIMAAPAAFKSVLAFGVPILGYDRPDVSIAWMVVAGAFVILCCMLAALVTRRYRAPATLPVTYGVSGILLIAAAISAGALLPLVFILVFVVLACAIGETLLRRLPVTVSEPIVSWPLAFGIGMMVIGLLAFLLATARMLNTTSVILSGGVIAIALLLIDRRCWRADLAGLRTWRPASPTWFETIVTGVTVGLVTFALLSTFVPENMSDAMRQHLPVAREIWQSDSLAYFSPLSLSAQPMQAHLLYALGYGLAGISGAKLIHAVVGLAGILAIGGLGWLCGGRLAAVISAAAFATMPLVLWELGHAHVDLFTVSCAALAALCVLLWQRDGAWLWLAGAGAFASFGYATKLTMVLIIVALGASLFLVGRDPWRLSTQIKAVLAYGLGTVVILPWVVRTYVATHSLPGLGIFTDLLNKRLAGGGGVPPSAATPAQIATQGGSTAAVSVAQEPMMAKLAGKVIDALTMPWRLTFHTDQFTLPVIGAGEIGLVLLLLLPLVLLAPRTRAMAFLAATVLISLVAWWLSPLQLVRHLLPTLGIACALAGAGIASLLTSDSGRVGRWLATAAPVGTVAGLLAVPAFFVSAPLAQIPIDVILRQTTPGEYIDRVTRWTEPLLTSADDLLPPDTLVGYVGIEEGAQIYTQVRLTYMTPSSLGATPEEVQANLERQGINYFIWERQQTRPEDWSSALLSPAFLSDHTRILAGDNDTYLFEVLPQRASVWGAEKTMQRLQDPELDLVGGAGPWTIQGKVKTARGVAAPRYGAVIAQDVAVDGGKPYLLVASTRCATPADDALLTLRWFDGQNAEIGTETEKVYPGTDWSKQFVWRQAPENASLVAVELQTSATMYRSNCEFDEASLYAMP